MDRRSGLFTLGVLILASVGAYGVSFSDDCDAFAVAAFAVGLAAIIACTAIVALAIAKGVAAVAIATAIIAFANDGGYVSAIGLLALTESLVIVFAASWDKEKGDFSPFLLAIFFTVFLIVATSQGVIASRYHNLNQIARDKKIIEAMAITVKEETVEVSLPIPESAGNETYLKQTLSVTAAGKKYPWRKSAIYCQEGPVVWHKLVVDNSASDGIKELVFNFRHVWWNYEGKKAVPVSPS